MSSETFRRLPEEKRQRFLQAAWDEFTKVKFEDASINKIIQAAGVPRGSFYQYFKDKEELFSDLAAELRQDYTDDYIKLLQQFQGDFFRTQVACFDFLSEQEQYFCTDMRFQRMQKVMKLNPGLDLHRMLKFDSMIFLQEELLQHMEQTGFIRTDAEYVIAVFQLTLMALAGAYVDFLNTPGRKEEIRESLLLQLEIVRRGSIEQK